MSRRFVELVSASEGDFGRSFLADEPPAPLLPSEAKDLDAYMRSFCQEVFDWKQSEDSEEVGHVESLHVVPRSQTVAEGQQRQEGWSIKVFAKKGSDEIQAVFGECAVHSRLWELFR